MIVKRFGDFKASPAHVADRPDRAEEAGDHAQRCKTRLFCSAKDANLKAGFRRDGRRQRRSVRGAADRLGPCYVDLGHTHGVRNRAKPSHRLDCAAKPVRGDGAGLRESVAEPAQRLLIETRQRRAPVLIVDNEPHGIGADVDDRVRRALGAAGALGVEIQGA